MLKMSKMKVLPILFFSGCFVLPLISYGESNSVTIQDSSQLLGDALGWISSSSSNPTTVNNPKGYGLIVSIHADVGSKTSTQVSCNGTSNIYLKPGQSYTCVTTGSASWATADSNYTTFGTYSVGPAT